MKRLHYLLLGHLQWSLLLLTMLFIFSFSSCSEQKEQKKYTIGFSQCSEFAPWRMSMLEEMKRELSFHSNLNFIYRQAGRNSQKQVEQIRELLSQGIDILIISPNETEPLTPIVEEVFNSGIPVIVVDRKIASNLYTAYVGADNYEIGKMAGQYAAQLLNGKGKIIEISGIPKSSPAIERHTGFIDVLHTYSSIKIIETIDGKWEKHKVQEELFQRPSDLNSIDLIYAHNDLMGLGAYEVFIKEKISKIPKIIGVDGLPGKGGGMEFVADKVLTATLLYPTGGQEAIQIALKILNKQAYKKDNHLQTSVIDSTNVRLLSLQNSKVVNLQKGIERQQTMLTEQQRIYNNQQTLLYVLISSLALAIFLGGVAFCSLTANRKINLKLKKKNLEILDQKNQLVEMSAKAKDATEAKFNFFTKISHEFRTPLSLILGPLENVLTTPKLDLSIKNNIEIANKNAMRLLRLVNQLIDFRKIEVDKMNPRASENDLIQFINEIMHSFKSIADKRNIFLKLITEERQLKVWFDTSMVEKVMFNLLSNAFKFAGDNGYINIYISKNVTENVALIRVEDNGIGMTKDEQEHAFDFFYQGEDEQAKGSGIGLALSKELIQLHKGCITVESKKWKGTTFKIQLQLGNSHFIKDEIIENPPALMLNGQEKLFTTELGAEELAKEGVQVSSGIKEFSILIIEDNEELRKLLVERLCKNYEILEACNGTSALQQGFDYIPDLIVSDIMIPEKDGISLTHVFKNDIRTSHIPIILLTAKTNIQQQIEGMKNMADAYITKPFNFQFLEETIKSLILNRNRLKDHFSSDISSNLTTKPVNKLDRKFVNEFTSFIESNLSNENLSVEEVSKGLGIPKIQLHRKIKALLGVNVSDYILNTRLNKAKYMLQNENFTISEIACRTGFSSPSYFSTVFKSKLGITPKAYKNELS
jgi:signal transduction histidine kinase/DNA-binding response OmpR family regulator